MVPYGVTGLKDASSFKHVVSRRPVRAAGGGKKESLHPGLLGQPCEFDGRLMVDIEGQAGIEVA